MKGGDYLGDQDAIEVLCSEGPEVIRQLEQMSVPWSRTPDGRPAQRSLGGAGFPGPATQPTFPATWYSTRCIMKIINTAVDDVRKAEVKEQSLLRGQKYIFLKNRKNLTEAQQKSLKAIEAMPRLNLKTVRAYHIRENFQEIYKEETREGFMRALKKWYFWATHSRIGPIRDAAKTIRRHWSGVLHWYDSKINNGILEGLNSLVQATKAKARGYRTFKNLKTIIYMLTGKLDFTKVSLPT
ncbi:MAG: transposase [Deltaproteobacteria bacterium]|nr:transposase [Deltaproteobacteria bacterium]